MSETHVSDTKPCSRMRSLSESRGGSKVTKRIFGNSGKRYSYTVTLPSLCIHVPLHITPSHHRALLCFGSFNT